MKFCARIAGQIGTGSAPFLIGSLAARYGRHKRLCSGQVGRPQCHSYANAVSLLSALQIPWFAFLWSPVSIKPGKNTFFFFFFFLFLLSEVLKDGLHLFLHADNSQETNIFISEDEMTNEYILFCCCCSEINGEPLWPCCSNPAERRRAPFHSITIKQSKSRTINELHYHHLREQPEQCL